MTKNIEPISPDRARILQETGKADLVCAYDDVETCRKKALDGAKPLAEFEALTGSRLNTAAVIFYCDCPNDETAKQKALEYQSEGFENTHFLDGGFEAWKSEGLPLGSTAQA